MRNAENPWSEGEIQVFFHTAGDFACGSSSGRHGLFDETQDFATARVCFGRSEKNGRQFRAPCQERARDAFAAGARGGLGLLVDFGENEGVRHVAFSKPLDKINVDALRFEPRINEHKDAKEIFARLDVASHRLIEIGALFLRDSRIAVAGQINETPLPATLIDSKKIQQLGLARCGGNFCEIAPPDEHIDERRFADIGAPNHGKLRLISRRTVMKLCCTSDKGCCFDFHILEKKT
jgi:hypothetical protein